MAAEFFLLRSVLVYGSVSHMQGTVDARPPWGILEGGGFWICDGEVRCGNEEDKGRGGYMRHFTNQSSQHKAANEFIITPFHPIRSS